MTKSARWMTFHGEWTIHFVDGKSQQLSTKIM
eukprot:COSAG04_NODE_20593_length_390_cov_1.020619_1_plen_31_part_10